MLIVEVCVGSSCHLKGSPQIVELLQNEVAKNHLEEDILLTGSFCTGKCNRVGVTVAVGETVHTGITVENFYRFWNETLLPALEKERG